MVFYSDKTVRILGLNTDNPVYLKCSGYSEVQISAPFGRFVTDVSVDVDS